MFCEMDVRIDPGAAGKMYATSCNVSMDVDWNALRNGVEPNNELRRVRRACA
jgi:hypothetical protein